MAWKIFVCREVSDYIIRHLLENIFLAVFTVSGFEHVTHLRAVFFLVIIYSFSAITRFVLNVRYVSVQSQYLRVVEPLCIEHNDRDHSGIKWSVL